MKYISKSGLIEWMNDWTDKFGSMNGSHGTKFPSVIWRDGGTVWHYHGTAWRERGPAALDPGGRTSLGSFNVQLPL